MFKTVGKYNGANPILVVSRARAPARFYITLIIIIMFATFLNGCAALCCHDDYDDMMIFPFPECSSPVSDDKVIILTSLTEAGGVL